jgi:hypothetical protein
MSDLQPAPWPVATPEQLVRARHAVAALGIASHEGTRDPLAAPLTVIQVMQALAWVHDDPANATALVHVVGELANVHISILELLLADSEESALQARALLARWAESPGA